MQDVYVVEGKNDVIKLHQVKKDAYYVITNGSEISKETIFEIKTLSLNNNIILLLDPDGPGEKIRRKIIDNVPNAINVFIPKKFAISSNRKKVGIEHVDNAVLSEYLEIFHNQVNKSDVDMKFLYALDMVGKNCSKEVRQKVCEHLNIGYANAKTFIYKCNLFGINKADILKARKAI